MSDFFEKAREKKQNEEYGAAATFFALDAIEELIREEFEQGRSMRVNSAILLRAISCDARAGNTRRPEFLFHLLEPMLAEIKQTADDDILKGLVEEWWGDAKLMLGRMTAESHYRRAAELYQNSEPVEPWAVEEESDYAYWAAENFYESEGRPLQDHHYHELSSRIEFKIDAVQQILPDTD